MLQFGFVACFVAGMVWRERAQVGAEERRYQALLEQARLSAQQAIEIGRAAADRREMSPSMSAILRDVAGRLVWTLFDTVIGASTSVEVDDATEKVLAVRRHPGRSP
jgi:hypothetical protein